MLRNAGSYEKLVLVFGHYAGGDDRDGVNKGEYS